jgi:hypothetical protein
MFRMKGIYIKLYGFIVIALFALITVNYYVVELFSSPFYVYFTRVLILITAFGYLPFLYNEYRRGYLFFAYNPNIKIYREYSAFLFYLIILFRAFICIALTLSMMMLIT